MLRYLQLYRELSCLLRFDLRLGDNRVVHVALGGRLEDTLAVHPIRPGLDDAVEANLHVQHRLRAVRVIDRHLGDNRLTNGEEGLLKCDH